MAADNPATPINVTSLAESVFPMLIVTEVKLDLLARETKILRLQKFSPPPPDVIMYKLELIRESYEQVRFFTNKSAFSG